MSADNWRICPQCDQKRHLAIGQMEREAEEAYGKVSAAEYARLVKKAKDYPSLDQTLREDYEIGTRNGEFEIYYGCSCRTCGFEFQYEHKQRVFPKPEAGNVK